MRIVIVTLAAIVVTSCTALTIASGVIGGINSIKTHNEIEQLKEDMKEIKKDE